MAFKVSVFRGMHSARETDLKYSAQPQVATSLTATPMKPGAAHHRNEALKAEPWLTL